MTVIDLLTDNAKSARQIIQDFEPKMTKEAYLEFMNRVSKETTA